MEEEAGSQPQAPQVTHPQKVIRCISIDGQGRDVAEYPMRYKFISTLNEALRTVSTVSASSVVISNKDHNINCPYLLLVINELSGKWTYSDREPVRRSFAKLVPQTTYSSPKGREYIVLQPLCAGHSVQFNPPLPSLSKLSISLTRPSGELVSAARDDYCACKVIQSSDGNWIVVTSTFWLTSEFETGDIVYLTGDSSGNDALDAYLFREQGHEVLDIGRPLTDEGCNKVIIRYAGRISQSTGAYEQDEKAGAAFSGSGTNNVGEVSIKATMINLSNQISVTLEVGCGTRG